MQNSWPQVYPGMPTGGYSPAWQNYFQVTEKLPNVTWSLPRNWAGNIPVQRAGHPNDTLFFWGFESSNGSFTANSGEPWGIWLNGGPGASSLLGLLIENGPIHLLSNYSLVQNPYAWSTVADYVWIDQPVGTGFSTVDINGYAPDEDQVAADFMGFLENFVKVFPNLATRPLHITGESYAGTYIPYITKAYFGMDNPPVNLTGIAIGDGTITSLETFNELPVVTVLETYPQIIGYDTQVFEYFQEQSALCEYNLTLQYPQPEHFPSLNAPIPFSAAYSAEYSAKLTKQQFVREVQGRHVEKLGKRDSAGAQQEHGERLRAHDMWKRDLAGRANGTIDPLYECDLYTEMIDYAVNFTFPWSVGREFDVYSIPDALSPEAPTDGSVFLNDAQTRAAIHAPTSKNWVEVIPEPFGPNNFKYVYGDPSVEPMAFLTELATNATAHDVSIVIYSGNDDSLVPHFGSQIAIQNTTFGGIQGFTRKPETPWYNDAGEFAGIVHQERGWKYVLVANAGHLLGYNNPISALTLVREFIFGNNQTGLVTNTSSGGVSVVGGEMTSLGNEILTGQAAIYYGAATTASSYFFPSATIEAWNTFISTATPSATSGTSPTPSMGLVSSKVFFFGSALAIVLVFVHNNNLPCSQALWTCALLMQHFYKLGKGHADLVRWQYILPIFVSWTILARFHQDTPKTEFDCALPKICKHVIANHSDSFPAAAMRLCGRGLATATAIAITLALRTGSVVPKLDIEIMLQIAQYSLEKRPCRFPDDRCGRLCGFFECVDEWAWAKGESVVGGFEVAGFVEGDERWAGLGFGVGVCI